MSRNKHTAVTQDQSHFAKAVHANIQRSTFFRNSTKKTTFNASELVPIYIDEILPGDTFEMDMKFISRLTTLQSPTMDVLNLDFYAFFVPNRLVWDGWEALNGQNDTSAWVQDPPPALVPHFSDTDLEQGNGLLGDYFGIPVGMFMDKYSVNVLPFRGYALIWNEWFRNQNLQAPIPIRKGDTDDITSLYNPNGALLRANKKHDYFTSCLPAPQKGDSALIPVSLGDLIPVITTSPAMANVPIQTQGVTWRIADDGSAPQDCVLGVTNQGPGATRIATVSGVTYDTTRRLYPSNLWADGRGVDLSSTTIHELRTAFQLQKLYERDARGGTRYVEMLKSHFGVDAQDYRLQRPEFLGQYNSNVGIFQVPQMSSTDGTSPQGNMAAFSLTSGQGSLFKKSFVEHGFLHIYAVARHPKTYQQGLERFWSRRERFDYYYPALAHISEQPVYKKEIFALSNLGPSADGNEIFGYNEAWADYRYKPNQVTGQFRSQIPNSLDIWHYADNYDAEPSLSDEWIQDNSRENVDRTLSVSSFHPSIPVLPGQNQILLDITFLCKATRPMPLHSIPGLVDHF